MIKVLVVLLASVAIAQSAVLQYQERRVYYNEDENICDHPGNEWVNLAISVDGKLAKEVMVKTHTICDSWATKDADKIGVLSRWSYFDEANHITFNDLVSA